MPVGQFPKTSLRDLFTAASADALNLLSKCLTYEPRRRISAGEVRLVVLAIGFTDLRKALTHAYFFALPYPTHPSKLPKCSKQLTASRPLEEVDGNVDKDPTGPGVHAKNNRLKRKLSSPLDDSKGRSLARRLDFAKQGPA